MARTLSTVVLAQIMGHVAACVCPSHTTDQNGPFTPGCDCLPDSGYVWSDPSCSMPNCQAITLTASCQQSYGSHSHSSGSSGNSITCVCDTGYTGIDEGQCKPEPTSGLANAIQNAAPDQSCKIEIWHDALGALAGVLTGTGGGQTDCSGDPDLSGDCLETIEGLISSAGPEAEFAADIISAMTGTDAKEICTEICTQGCGDVLGWAMWFESPCIVDAAPVATFRIVCMPPWGLVAVICILVVLYGCFKACDDDDKKKNQRSRALSVPLTDMRV